MPSINSQPQPVGSPPLRPETATNHSVSAQPGLVETAASLPVQSADQSLLTALEPGKAQTFLSLNDDKALEAWKAAAKGEKVPLVAKPGEKLAHVNALMTHVGKASFSPEQKQRVSKFLASFPAQFTQDPGQKLKALKLLDELLSKRGISQGQLKLIANGKFTAADLVRLINHNPAPSLIGKFPGFLPPAFFGAQSFHLADPPAPPPPRDLPDG